VNKSIHDPQLEWIKTLIEAAQNCPMILPQGRVHWWVNPSNHKSLRLSGKAYMWIKKYTTIPHWQIPINADISSKQVIQLERVFKHPYYLNNSLSITLFGEEDVVMLQLHAGDLGTYLNNLQL
jgi:hypothetical protein